MTPVVSDKILQVSKNSRMSFLSSLTFIIRFSAHGSPFTVHGIFGQKELN
jgi:hypothetical protein